MPRSATRLRFRIARRQRLPEDGSIGEHLSTGLGIDTRLGDHLDPVGQTESVQSRLDGSHRSPFGRLDLVDPTHRRVEDGDLGTGGVDHGERVRALRIRCDRRAGHHRGDEDRGDAEGGAPSPK